LIPQVLSGNPGNSAGCPDGSKKRAKNTVALLLLIFFDTKQKRYKSLPDIVFGVSFGKQQPEQHQQPSNCLKMALKKVSRRRHSW
jgi:hypothetical protein